MVSQGTFLVLSEVTEFPSSRYSVIDMKPQKHTSEFIAMEKDKEMNNCVIKGT